MSNQRWNTKIIENEDDKMSNELNLSIFFYTKELIEKYQIITPNDLFVTHMMMHSKKFHKGIEFDLYEEKLSEYEQIYNASFVIYNIIICKEIDYLKIMANIDDEEIYIHYEYNMSKLQQPFHKKLFREKLFEIIHELKQKLSIEITFEVSKNTYEIK